MNISELITAVRVWQAAYAAYRAAWEESPHSVTYKRRDTMDALNEAAIAVTLNLHNDEVLAAFVALADIVEPALKLAATVERHQLPISGKGTHEFSFNGWQNGWIDKDVRKGAYDGFLGALINLVSAVEKGCGNNG